MKTFKPAGWYVRFKLEGTGPTQIVTRHYDTLTAAATMKRVKRDYLQPIEIRELWQAGTHKKI